MKRSSILKNVKRVVSVSLTLAMVVTSGSINLATQTVKAASTWRSALYPENWQPGYTNSAGQFLHDFSYAGYEKGEKDIPSSMSGLYANVLNYGADNTGSADSTAAIQNAINAVETAGGGTVYLPAGTYKVKPTSGSNASALRIKGSNILFKGDGVGKTFIRCYSENMRFCQVINVSPNGGTWNSADDGKYYYLSKDISSTPTKTVYLNSVGNLKEGDWVIIRSDRTQSWINEHGMSGFWSASVSSTTMGTTFYRKITSVNKSNNSIQIDIPTRYYMKTRDNARVYKVTPKQSNVGLVGFSIGNKANSNTKGWGEEDYKTSGNGSYNVNNAFLIKFGHNVNCFAKNISTYNAGNSNGYHMSSNGLDISQTRNLTVDNCDFSNPQYEGGGGNGYGMNICGQETLIKNCSSTSARHSFSFKYAYASGNVVYHYTSTNPKYGSDFHMYLSMSNLIDNEELNGDFVETNVRPYGGTAGNRHGYTSTQTVFWNTKGNYYKSGMSYIIDSRQFGYGYIIGTQGAATNVKTTPTTMNSTYGSVNTAPEDYKEGIGKGTTLSPQSLYYDQLSKRLNGNNGSGTGSNSNNGATTATTTQIPGTIKVNSCSDKTSSVTFTTENGVTYAGNLKDGSYLNYKVKVASTGDYKITLKLAAGDSKWNAENALIKLDGNTKATLPITGSSSWTNFVNHIAIGNMAAGEQTLSVQSVGGACNVADIIVEKVASASTGSSASTGENLAKGKTVTASGYEADGTMAKYAVDGNTDSRWSSNFADNAWITVDLGKTYAVNKVVLKWEGAYGKAYNIQTSTDGSNWTTVKSLTEQDGGTDTISFSATNARYVRMQGVTRALPYGYSLYEFEVYGGETTSSGNATGGTTNAGTATSNIAKGKTVTASGSEAEGTLAKYAVDGNADSRWSSNFADNAWITVDLEKTYAVNKVILKWEGAYGEAYKIQTSTDGSNWTTVKSLTGQDGGTDTISFSTTNARYVRMQGVTRALPYGYSLWEMEVYGN